VLAFEVHRDDAEPLRDPYTAAPTPTATERRGARLDSIVLPAPRGGSRLIWIVTPLVGLLSAGVAVVGMFAFHPPSLLPPATTTTEVVEHTPDVVSAIKSLARLETTAFHIEHVVDLADHETRGWGLVEAKDAILLVAVGDVIAGVDLSKVTAADVDADFAQKRVSVTLPAPEVFSAQLDEQATHVFSRHTDVLASRHEDLEGRARKEAQRSMEKAARDAGALDKARQGAEASVRALLEAAGFTEVDVRFAGDAR
jgi:hypothetical protein